MQQNRFAAEPADESTDSVAIVSEEDEPEAILRELARELTAWAKANRDRLRLDPAFPVALRGFHPVHRIASGGELLVEMVAHFVQTQKLSEDLGGLKYRAGVTMIANIDGQVRYVIDKPFHSARKSGLDDWVREFDAADGNEWSTRERDTNRLMAAFSARAMAKP